MRNYKKNQTFPSPAVHVAGNAKAAARITDRVRASRIHEEITKRTIETITYLQHNSLRRKTSRRPRRKSTNENTHIPTDQTLASRV